MTAERGILWLVTASLLMLMGDRPVAQSPPVGGLSVRLNRTSFGRGEILQLTARLRPISPSRPVDAYVVAELPGGQMLSLQLNGALVPGLAPIARSLQPFDFAGEIALHRFSGSEPLGTYTWHAALTEPGTLNIIGEIQSTPFSVSATPTTNTAMIPNADTRAIAVLSTTSGMSATYFGPKDENGVPERISEVVATGVRGKDVKLVYEESGRPSYALVSGGGRVDFRYSSRRVEIVIGVANGETVTLAYDPTTREILPGTAGTTRLAPNATDLIESPSATRQGQITTTCGARHVSADMVSVNFSVAPSGVVVPLQPTAVSAGVYTYDVPNTPLPSSGWQHRIAARIESEFRNLCILLGADAPGALSLSTQLQAHLVFLAGAINPAAGVAVGLAFALADAICMFPSAVELIDHVLDMSAAAGRIDVRAERGAESVSDFNLYPGGLVFNPPSFRIPFQQGCTCQGLVTGRWHMLAENPAAPPTEIYWNLSEDADGRIAGTLVVVDQDEGDSWTVDGGQTRPDGAFSIETSSSVLGISVALEGSLDTPSCSTGRGTGSESENSHTFNWTWTRTSP